MILAPRHLQQRQRQSTGSEASHADPVHHKLQPDNSSNTYPDQQEKQSHAEPHPGVWGAKRQRWIADSSDKVSVTKIRPSRKERMRRMSGRWKMCLCKLRAWEERQNNIPRHVRIKKLAAKARNNVPLVDWREKNVSIQIYFDVEQRPDWTTAWPGAEPLNQIRCH